MVMGFIQVPLDKRLQSVGNLKLCRLLGDSATLQFLLCFFKVFYLFIYLLAVLDLRCCVWAFSSCRERGLLFVVMRGLLTVVAFLVAEHGL